MAGGHGSPQPRGESHRLSGKHDDGDDDDYDDHNDDDDDDYDVHNDDDDDDRNDDDDDNIIAVKMMTAAKNITKYGSVPIRIENEMKNDNDES